MACAAFMRATSAGSFTARKARTKSVVSRSWGGSRRLGERALERSETRKRHAVLDAQHDVGGRYATRCVRMARREHIGHPGAVARARIVYGDNTFAGSCLARGARIARIGVQHRIVRRDQQRMRLLVVEHVIERRQPFDACGVTHQKRTDTSLCRRFAQTRQTSCGLGFHTIRHDNHDLP